MITGKDMNTVFTAIVPLYVAMLLAYGSVKWWGILTRTQCGGINRFVSIFAVPLLSFQFISGNNPYEMNVKFMAADLVSKLFVLFCLGVWARYSNRGSFDWMITLFVLITMPNTLVMGTPLLTAMYGKPEGQLTVQAVVLQCAIWYTLLLALYEYRAAKLLITKQFPENAAAIVSFKVDSDVMSLDGRNPIHTEAEVGDDGKLHVKVRRSDSMPSSKSLTPRASSLSGADIYSTNSSVNRTPRSSSFNQGECFSMIEERSFEHRGSNLDTSDVYSLQSSRCPTPPPTPARTPRTSNFTEEIAKELRFGHQVGLSINMNSSRLIPPFHRHGAGGRKFMPRSDLAGGPEPVGHGALSGMCSDGRTKFPGSIIIGAMDFQSSGASSSSQVVNPVFSPRASETARKVKNLLRVSSKSKDVEDAKELHMFVWSENASPIPDPAGGTHVFGSGNDHAAADLTQQSLDAEEVHVHIAHSEHGLSTGNPRTNEEYTEESTREAFSFGNEAEDIEKDTAELAPKLPEDEAAKGMPPSTVMIKLIAIMTFRKLVWNPNTYSTLLGVIWSLVAFRWSIKMPGILYHSYHIISDAGLGMAMFSLGLFMGLGDQIIACGTKLAVFGMFLRFLMSPALFAAASYMVGIRGVTLKVCIVQAALPQGIVPFVFAKEYNVHPDILSTAVIFGMLVALPITLLYYILLGL